MEEASGTGKEQAKKQFMRTWEKIEVRLPDNEDRARKREQRRAHRASQRRQRQEPTVQESAEVKMEEDRENMVEELD